MNRLEIQTEQQGGAVAAGEAKRRGMRMAKVWMAAYACLVIAYVLHGVTGAEFVRVDALTAGRRPWHALHVESAGGTEEIAPGAALSPAALETVLAGAPLMGGFTREGDAWRRAEKGPATSSLFIKLYKADALHNLPWPSLLGLFNFAGLALLLYTFLGDPLPAMLREWTTKVREQLERTRAARAEAAALQDKERVFAAQLDVERTQAMEQAERDAEAERDYLIEAAKRDAGKRTEAMQHHIESDAKAAAAQLRAAVARRVLEQARARFAEGGDGVTQDAMIRAFARQLEDGGGHD